MKYEKIYFITGNENKFKEVKFIIPNIERLDIDLPEIQELDARKVIEAKLREAFKHKSGCFIVEDTSLCLACQNGLPGHLIKWHLKAIGNEGLYDIARKFNNFDAEAKTLIGFANNPNNIHFFEGLIKGKIVSPRGDRGFDWDSIFQPDGYSKSFAELNMEEKNDVSMRRIALNKLKEFLKEDNP